MLALILERQLELPDEGDDDVIHVLNEAASPLEGECYVMWCGVSAVAAPRGRWEPFLNFYVEKWWFRASCPKCLAAVARRA